MPAKRPHKYTYTARSEGNPLKRVVNKWADRLLGAVSDRSLAGQEEEYESGRTSRDFIWNTAGFAAWGMVFPLLTIVVTQLVGVERAGMFSMAFVVAILLYILGTYGMRTYQVSDLDEYHSFNDYQASRFITCAAMMIVGILFAVVHNYEGEMFVMAIAICAYKAIDALGEVYEGRLQQVDKLYLAGISLTLRSAAAFIVFSLVLVITGNLGTAAIGMAIASLATYAFVTLPLTLFETQKSMSLNVRSVQYLLRECAPVFAALFLYALVDNLPKFMIEGFLNYDSQLYFNALYFPAMAVLLIVGFIYKPLLVRMSNLWADSQKHRQFDMLIIAIFVVIAVVTLIMALIMRWIGIPLMSILYGVDFEPFRRMCYIMIAAGGMTACIDFVYQVITILRRQRVVLGLYVVTFVLSLLILFVLITSVGLEGAVIGYLVVMAILFVLLLREYLSVRLGASRRGR